MQWKADIQSYMQEFAQKERHFAKIQAEHKYLTEEVEALRKAEGQRSKETESVTHLHKVYLPLCWLCHFSSVDHLPLELRVAVVVTPHLKKG